MEIKMVCGTWMKEDDEKILKILMDSDKWLSAEELSEITGLPLHKVQGTLSGIKQQMDFYNARQQFLKDCPEPNEDIEKKNVVANSED